MSVTKDDVISFIDGMTVLEMSEFVKELEDKYGVTAAAPAAMMAMPAGGDAGGAAGREDGIDVVLTAAGDKKNSGYQRSAHDYRIGLEGCERFG